MSASAIYRHSRDTAYEIRVHRDPVDSLDDSQSRPQ
jgi:hypothetical protein